MTTPATRIITLIMLLQRKPNQKAADLASKIGVSIRTLHRYFERLEEIGIPIYSERGPNGGFSLVRGYKLPPLVFTPEEAVALYLGTSLVTEMWGQLYQEAANGAMAKLANVLPEEQLGEVAWAQRSLIATGLHRADPTSLTPFLEKIRRGTRERRLVEIRYQRGDSLKSTTREVEPYALVHRSGWWYLVGYCHLRKGMRTFRVDRIQNITLLDRNFQLPQDFEIHTYLDESFKEQAGIRARMVFVPEAAAIVLANRSSWESTREMADGSIEVLVTAPDLYWLGSLVLSFAHWVTVIEPPKLRALVKAWAQSVADLYQIEEELI